MVRSRSRSRSRERSDSGEEVFTPATSASSEDEDGKTFCHDAKHKPSFGTRRARAAHYEKYHGGIDPHVQHRAQRTREKRGRSVRSALADLSRHQRDLRRGQEHTNRTVNAVLHLLTTGSGRDGRRGDPDSSGVVGAGFDGDHDDPFGNVVGADDVDLVERSEDAGGPVPGVPKAPPPPPRYKVSLQTLLMSKQMYAFEDGARTVYPFRNIFATKSEHNAGGALDDSALQHPSFVRKRLHYAANGSGYAYAVAGMGLFYSVLVTGSRRGLLDVGKERICVPEGLKFSAQEACRVYIQSEFVDEIVYALEKLEIGSFAVALRFVVRENQRKFKANNPADRGVSLSGITNGFVFLTRFVMFLHRKTSRYDGHLMLEDWFNTLLTEQRRHSKVKVDLDRQRKEERERLEHLSTKQVMEFAGSLAAVILAGTKAVLKDLKREEATALVFDGYGDVPLRPSGKNKMSIGSPSSTIYVDDDGNTHLTITKTELQKQHSNGGSMILPRGSALSEWGRQYYRDVFGVRHPGDPKLTAAQKKAERDKVYSAMGRRLIPFPDMTTDEALYKLIGPKGNLPDSTKGSRSLHATLQWLGLRVGWFDDADVDFLQLRMLHKPTTSAGHYLLLSKVELDELTIPPQLEQRFDASTRTMDAYERDAHFSGYIDGGGGGNSFSLKRETLKKLEFQMPRVHEKFYNFLRALTGEDALCSYCGDFDEEKKNWDDAQFVRPRPRRANHGCFDLLRNARETGVLAGMQPTGAYGAWLTPRELIDKFSKKVAGGTLDSSDSDDAGKDGDGKGDVDSDEVDEEVDEAILEEFMNPQGGHGAGRSPSDSEDSPDGAAGDQDDLEDDHELEDATGHQSNSEDDHELEDATGHQSDDERILPDFTFAGSAQVQLRRFLEDMFDLTGLCSKEFLLHSLTCVARRKNAQNRLAGVRRSDLMIKLGEVAAEVQSGIYYRVDCEGALVPFRNLVISLFEQGVAYEDKDIEAARKHTKPVPTPSKAEYSKVMNEFAQQYEDMWILKSGEETF
jgi:hypothetical protein